MGVSDVVVGVDGGNSKTDVVVAGLDGAVRHALRGPTTSRERLGVDRAVEVLDDLVRRALTESGLLPTDGPRALAAMLAGLDLPEHAPAFAEALGRRFPGTALAVDNDTVAVLLAGTGGGPGAAVVCGAGINAAGLSPSGERTGFLSVGRISGDWGGGEFLGGEALWHAVRAEDGRGPATTLAAGVREHFGTTTVLDLVLALARGEVDSARVGELVKVMFEADAGGDAVARSVVARLAEEVAVLAHVVLARAGLAGASVPVVLAGGVLTAGHELLLADVRAELARTDPSVVVDVLRARPVAGAVLAALRALPPRSRTWPGRA